MCLLLATESRSVPSAGALQTNRPHEAGRQAGKQAGCAAAAAVTKVVRLPPPPPPPTAVYNDVVAAAAADAAAAPLFWYEIQRTIVVDQTRAHRTRMHGAHTASHRHSSKRSHSNARARTSADIHTPVRTRTEERRPYFSRQQRSWFTWGKRIPRVLQNPPRAGTDRTMETEQEAPTGGDPFWSNTRRGNADRGGGNSWTAKDV